MKNYVYAAAVAVALLGLFGCGQIEQNNPPPEKQEEGLQTERAETLDGNFIYRLVSEKSHYKEGEPVKIYAELEYIGLEEEATIEHSSSPFLFPMKETTRNYEIDYAVNTIGNQSVLKKGVPLREEIQGSGGYSEQDKETYKEFIKQVMEKNYPTGRYIVSGNAWFREADSQEEHIIHAQIEFAID